MILIPFPLIQDSPEPREHKKCIKQNRVAWRMFFHQAVLLQEPKINLARMSRLADIHLLPGGFWKIPETQKINATTFSCINKIIHHAINLGIQFNEYNSPNLVSFAYFECEMVLLSQKKWLPLVLPQSSSKQTLNSLNTLSNSFSISLPWLPFS